MAYADTQRMVIQSAYSISFLGKKTVKSETKRCYEPGMMLIEG